MFKKTLQNNSNEKSFVRQSIIEGVRLDGRKISDYRDIHINLSRDECRSESSIILGNTRVICVVSGEIVKPYADRSTEGILQFSVNVSPLSEECDGPSTQSLLCRSVERSVRDSDAIDTESLCIIAGEKVWCITCDIRVLNYSGNLTDACNIAALSGLMAFRKPEVGVNLHEVKGERGAGAGLSHTYEGMSDPHNTISNHVTTSYISKIQIYSADEREPLPLALHHCPLSFTFGIFHMDKVAVLPGAMEETPNSESHQKLFFIVADPSAEEERAMQGKISLSVNAHRELCAIIKPGGVGMTTEDIIKASSLAIHRSVIVHEKLQNALNILENNFQAGKQARLDVLKSLRIAKQQYVLSKYLSEKGNDNDMDVEQEIEISLSGVMSSGIDLNDPILQYNLMHSSVGLSGV